MAESDDDLPIELNISIEKIRDIVLLARAFDFAEFPDDPDPGSEPDAVADPETILDDGEDPTEAELREMIDDLNEDELIDLIALIWVGRGDWRVSVRRRSLRITFWGCQLSAIISRRGLPRWVMPASTTSEPDVAI
jgi:hypothetical protein